MTLPSVLQDREQQKFRESANLKPVVAVISEESSDIAIVDTSTSGVIYFGVAPKSSLTSQAVWLVTKYDTSTTIITIKKSLPNQIWDSRASLTYE